MKTQEYIYNLINHRLICNDYVRKLDCASTKQDIFRVLCDINGIEFMMEMMSKNHILPWEDFKKDFANYINGKNVVKYPQGYTSCIYVNWNDIITAETTVIGVFISNCDIVIPKNTYPRIILSPNSHARISMTDTSCRVALDVWDNATYSISGDMSKVRINNHRNIQ